MTSVRTIDMIDTSRWMDDVSQDNRYDMKMVNRLQARISWCRPATYSPIPLDAEREEKGREGSERGSDGGRERRRDQAFVRIPLQKMAKKSWVGRWSQPSVQT